MSSIRKNWTLGRFITLGLILALGLAGRPAQAQVLTWTGSAGATWNTTNTNWSTVGVGTPWDSTNGPSYVADFATTGASAQINGSPAAVYANGVQFDNTGTVSGGSINLVTGTLATPAVTVNASSGTIASVLVGSAGLVTSGTGLLTLTAANSFTGGTTINSGTLQLNNATAAGPSSQTITLGDAGTGAKNVQLNLSSAAANPITVSGLGSGSATINALGNIASFNNAVAVNGPVTITSTGAPSNPAPTFALSGSGTVTFAVPTAAATQFIPVGNNSSFTGDIVVASPTVFEPRNNFSTPLGNNVTIQAGATMNVISFGNTTINGLNGTGTVTGRYQTGTLTVGIGNGSGTFSGTMQNGATVWPFVKTGTGTQVLSGANITYTGATTLTQGTLNLTNAPNFASAVTMDSSNLVDLQLGSTGSNSWVLGSQLNGGSNNAIIEKVGPGTVVLSPASGSSFVGSSSAALTVTGGALYLNNNNFNTTPAVSVGAAGTFGGNSTVGAATVAAGGGIVGGYAGAGSLTIASLAYSGAGSIQGTLANGTTPIVVTGAVTTGGSNTIAVSVANLPSDGVYNFLSYGSGTDPFGAFTLASPSRVLSLVDNPGSDLIQVNINTSVYPIWTGLHSGDWSLNAEPSPKNWRVNTGGATDFLAADAVVFDDSAGTAGGTTNVTLNNGNVNPGSVTFNNNNNNYTLSGTAGITTGSMTLNGSGAVTINTANSFGGGTTLNSGTLMVGNNAALGSGSLGINGGWLQATGGVIALPNSITATTTLQVYTDANSLTLDGPVTGIDLLKSGTGMLTLGAANNFSGAVTVSQGTLQLNNAATAGSATINLGDGNTGSANTQLNINSASVTNAIAVASAGPGSATINALGNIASFNNAVTLNGPATITSTGAPSNPAPTFSLAGSAAVTFSVPTSNEFIPVGDASGFTGDVVIAAPTNFEPRSFLSNPSGNNVTVQSGGTLQIISFGPTSINALNGNGTVQGRYQPGSLTVGVGDGSGTFSGTMQNYQTAWTLTKTGSGTEELAGGNINFTGATTLTQGTLRLTNATAWASPVTMDYSNTVDLQLNASSGTTWTFAQQINGGSNNSIIEKIGPGTVVLSPAAGSTFQGSGTGALTVTAGALYLTNSNLSSFAPPPVSVAPAAIFGGNTTVGAATVAAGGGIVGGYGGAGSLTLAGLTYSGTGTAAGVLSAGAAPIVVTGSVTANPASIAVSATNLPADGTYPFLSYTGTDPFSDFTLSSRVVGRTVLSLVDSSASDLIALTLTTSAYPIWTGKASGDWSLNSEPNPKNWRLNTGGATDFLSGDAVVFDDTVGTAGTTNVTLNNGNVTPGSTTFSNNAYNYTLSGTAGITTGNLTKNGTGSLTINTANSFGGGATLNAGTLIVGNNSALGSGGLLINGGCLQPTGGTIALNNPVTAPGNFALGAGTNSLTLNGILSLTSTGTNTIAVNGPVTFANTVTGNNLVQSGAGMLTLAAANNFTGGVTVSQGTLQLSTGTAAGTNAVNLGDANTGANNLALIVTDPGVANDINVNQGSGFATLSFTPTTNTITWGSVNNTITLNRAATITTPLETSYMEFNWALSGSGELDVGSTNAAQGGWIILFTQSPNFTGNVVIENNAILEPRDQLSAFGGNNVTVQSGGTLQLITFGATTIAGLSGSGDVRCRYEGTTLTVGEGDASSTFSGTMENGQAVWQLIKTGSGTFALTGANTFTGGTDVTNGLLQVGNASALGTGGLAADGGTVDLGGYSITVSSFSGAAGIVTNSASGTTATLNVNGANSSYVTVFSGSIVDGAGRVALSLEGGALQLTGSNGYSGGTTVYSDGNTLAPPVLQMGAVNALPYGPGMGNVTVSGSGTLDLAGNNTNVNGLSGNGTIDSTLGSGTLTVGYGDATSTFSGVLQNSNSIYGYLLALTKVGSGTLTLSGTNNSYQGGTIVAGGTLIATNDEAIADGTSLIVGDASYFGLVAPAAERAAASTAVTSVPEPGTSALFAVGLAIAAAYVWRRRKRAKS